MALNSNLSITMEYLRRISSGSRCLLLRHSSWQHGAESVLVDFGWRAEQRVNAHNYSTLLVGA